MAPPFLPRAVLALLLALTLAACAATPTVEKRPMDGVDNYSEIGATQSFAGSRIGFGGATDPQAMAALKDAGYASVISLRLGTEDTVDHAASRAAAERVGLRYVELPLSPEESPPGQVEAVLEAMGEVGRHPVYLHCGSATRAAAVWMIGRVEKDGLSRNAAAAEARMIAGKPDKAVGFADRYLDAQAR